jgi:hypothetical protein
MWFSAKHYQVGKFESLEGYPFRLNRMEALKSLILSMILSEKSATFRDHALTQSRGPMSAAADDRPRRRVRLTSNVDKILPRVERDQYFKLGHYR